MFDFCRHWLGLTKLDLRFSFPQFSSYVNVTSQPMSCSELKLKESLTCRLSKKFVSRYHQAVKQMEEKLSGIVMTKIHPIREGK